MARGRIIYPDFWTDSKVIAMSPFARLFYIGTWNFTNCDRGHLPDDAQGLKFKILPADQVDGAELLAEIMSSDRIVRVHVGNDSFLHIPTFERHQSSTTDKRWSTRCPACKLSETPVSFTKLTGALQNSPKLRVEGRGGEMSRGEGNTAPPRKCPKHINDTTSPKCGACRDARLEREDWDKAQKNRPTPSPRKDIPTPETCKHKYVAGWCVAGCESAQP